VVGVGIRFVPQFLFHFHCPFSVDLFQSMKENTHNPKGREVVQGQVICSEFTFSEIPQAHKEIKIFKPGHSLKILKANESALLHMQRH
jgi:hypothetical protein